MTGSNIRRIFLRASLLAAGLAGSASLGCVLYVEEDSSCGQNAYAYRGDCVCESGFQGGDPYGEGCTPAMTFLITDACDDGYDVAWKLFSDDREWTWPSGSGVYVTPGYDFDRYETIECELDEWICFGALSDGGLSYGVGIDNTESCENCCFQCDSIQYDLGYLTCN